MRLKIQLERVYTARTNARGKRILGDRLWPRGDSKDALKLDLWLRQLAPSNELRNRCGHDPRLWEEFDGRYCWNLQRPESNEQLHQQLAVARDRPDKLVY